MPRVWSIAFHGVAGDDPWIVDEMGLLLGRSAGYVWLCDDAISLTAGMRNAAPVNADGRWVLTTREGVFTSDDAGCSFERVAGELASHFVGPLSVDPRRNGAVLVGTASLGRANGTYLSLDGGRSWTLTGEASDGRVRDILRAPSDPSRVFVADGAGLAVSDDGGQTFVRRAYGPPEVAPRNDEVRLLAVDPRNADRLFLALERFPDGLVMVSDDAGLTWRQVLEVPDDSAETLYVDPNGPGWLLSTPFAGLFRSEDAGAHWRPIEPPGVLGCLTAEPETGAIWACLRGSPLPWVVARSTDGGETWDPQLRAYSEIHSGLECPADSPTALACRDQCEPANRVACPEADGGLPAADAALPAADRGVDRGVAQDAAEPSPDAATETRPRDVGGCDLGPGEAPGGPGGAALALAVAALTLRQRRPRARR